MSETIKIYLAGACRHLEDEGAEWREKATNMLQQTAEWQDVKVKIINPLDYFSYNDSKPKTHKQVKALYMNKILNCTLVLVNLCDSDKSVGTGQELQFAKDHQKAVVGFGRENVYPWLDVDCDATFDTLTEACDYIRDGFMK